MNKETYNRDYEVHLLNMWAQDKTNFIIRSIAKKFYDITIKQWKNNKSLSIMPN